LAVEIADAHGGSLGLDDSYIVVRCFGEEDRAFHVWRLRAELGPQGCCAGYVSSSGGTARIENSAAWKPQGAAPKART